MQLRDFQHCRFIFIQNFKFALTFHVRTEARNCHSVTCVCLECFQTPAAKVKDFLQKKQANGGKKNLFVI